MRFTIIAAAVVVAPACLAAQESAGGSDANALAKSLSNPVAALISVPFQLNYDSGFDGDGDGDGDGERWTLNVQPVIPIGLSKDWNLISRTIVPLIEQRDVVPGDHSQSGFGDVVQSLFFSPKASTASGWIWGVGPAFLIPTATDDLLGAEQWAIGPTAVVLKQTDGGWTYGALVNHLISVAGNDDREDVSATFLQPFLSKSLGKGATASVNFESTYDWEAQQWNIPLNVSYSKVTTLGGQKLSLAGGARAYLESPDEGPDWGARFTLTLLFPK